MSRDYTKELEERKAQLQPITDKIKYPRLRVKLGFEDTINDLIHLCTTCAPEDFPEYTHRLFYALPLAIKDKEFEEELKGCHEKVEYTTLVMNCGIPVDPKIMTTKTKIVEEWNWHLVFNAILNLWNRRDALLPKQLVEVIPSRE